MIRKMSYQSVVSILLLTLVKLYVEALVAPLPGSSRRTVPSRPRPLTVLHDAHGDPLGPRPSVAQKVEVKKRPLQLFTRYLEVECWKQPDLRGLETVLQAVADACKQINRVVQRAQTDDIYGAAVDAQGNPLDGTNIQGEVQQKLDVLCNTLMMRAFCGSGQAIGAVASEEEDEPRCCSDVMVSTNVPLASKSSIL